MTEINIRPLTDRDARAVLEAVEESRSEVSLWMDWCRPEYALADAELWIRTGIHGRRNGTQFQFGIFEDRRRFLGSCGISQIDPQAKLANLGYWVRTGATGRGVAAAAARRVIDWAFENTDVQRIEILAAVGNERSQRVAEKVGAVREGILRSRLAVFGRFHDAVVYSVVRGDLQGPSSGQCSGASRQLR